MSGIARFILTPWEKFYSKLAHEQLVVGGSGIGAYSIHPHHGPSVTLLDGSVIVDGDPILELHLINYRLRDVMASSDSLASNEMTLLRQEYQALARMVQRGDVSDFKAIYGMTLLSPMVKRLGFEVVPALDTRGNRAIAAWQDILRRAYYSTGHARKNKRSLVIYWMPKDKFVKTYGDG